MLETVWDYLDGEVPVARGVELVTLLTETFWFVALSIWRPLLIASWMCVVYFESLFFKSPLGGVTTMNADDMKKHLIKKITDFESKVLHDTFAGYFSSCKDAPSSMCVTKGYVVDPSSAVTTFAGLWRPRWPWYHWRDDQN